MPLTSLQDWMAMYSEKIFFALEAILDCDLIFLKSSHASQNSRFSSLNSVRRNALKAARPSEGGRRRKRRMEKEGEAQGERDGLKTVNTGMKHRAYSSY